MTKTEIINMPYHVTVEFILIVVLLVGSVLVLLNSTRSFLSRLSVIPKFSIHPEFNDSLQLKRPSTQAERTIHSVVNTAKALLFFVCLYSATPYSKNPRQEEHQFAYSNLKFLFMTNQGLYITLCVVAIGFIYRITGRFSRIYNTLLPVATVIETLITSAFWILYFSNKKAIINKKFLEPGYETPLLTELGVHLFPFILLLLDQYNLYIVSSFRQHLMIGWHFLTWFSIVMNVQYTLKKPIYPFMKYTFNPFIAVGFLIGGLVLLEVAVALYVRLLVYIKSSRHDTSNDVNELSANKSPDQNVLPEVVTIGNGSHISKDDIVTGINRHVRHRHIPDVNIRAAG